MLRGRQVNNEVKLIKMLDCHKKKAISILDQRDIRRTAFPTVLLVRPLGNELLCVAKE